MSFRFVPVLVIGAALVAGGCGQSASDDPQVLRAGQVDIRLPDGWKVTAQGAERPGGAAPSSGDAAAAGQASASSDTVPLAKQDPTTSFFQATAKFRDCLKEQGTPFIGAPDASNPDSPTNDPEYIKSLSTCASRSGIVQAMQDMQKSQDDLTPAEIEKQNKQYLKWRKCMIGKGWKIGEPHPDEKGRLFSFSGSQGAQIEPPPGKSILGDKDMESCANEAAA